MKIARLEWKGAPLWAVIDPPKNTAVALNGGARDWGPDCARGDASRHLDRSRSFALSDAKLLAPVEPTAKIVCIGLNYRKHVEAFGKTMPDAPMAFLKAMTAIIAPDQPLVKSKLTTMLDYEIELTAVIAQPMKPGRPVQESLLGYTIANDASARDLQRAGPRGADLYSGKSLNDMSGIGPWIVTADEIAYPPDLAMKLTVNGETRQNDRSGTMEWNLDALLPFVNDRTRLLPGDLVLTGTPAGVALEDNRFLEPGDEIELEIERIGKLRHRVVAPA